MLPTRKKDKFLSDSHQYAPKQEKMIAKKLLGGNIVSGSGCGYKKGDVYVDKIIRIEAKCTKHKSYSITRELIKRMENISLQDGEVPAFMIDFLTGVEVDLSIAVIPVWALEFLINNQGQK